MEFAQALDLVVARTKHERYRHLVDPTHPDFNPAYRATILVMAGALEPPPTADAAPGTTPNRHAARDLLVRSCDHRVDAVGLERGDVCGCLPATRCLLRRGKWPDDPCAVDYGDCLSCLS